jgi:hypothetical protein
VKPAMSAKAKVAAALLIAFWRLLVLNVKGAKTQIPL